MRAGFVIKFVISFVYTPTSKEGNTLGVNLRCTLCHQRDRCDQRRAEPDKRGRDILEQFWSRLVNCSVRFHASLLPLCLAGWGWTQKTITNHAMPQQRRLLWYRESGITIGLEMAPLSTSSPCCRRDGIFEGPRRRPSKGRQMRQSRAPLMQG